MSNPSPASLTPLIRLGAWGAILGGGLRAAASFVPYAANSPVLEAFYGTIDIALLFALVAVYLGGAAQTGRAGLIGFAIALVGMASILGPDAPAFGIDFYLAGSLVLLLGLSILAAAFWRSGHSRRPAQAWLLSTALAMFGAVLAQPILIAAGGVAFGLGFVLAGLALLRDTAAANRA